MFIIYQLIRRVYMDSKYSEQENELAAGGWEIASPTDPALRKTPLKATSDFSIFGKAIFG
jgi:hypothetical protein